MATVVSLNDGLIDRVMKRRAEASEKVKRLNIKSGSRATLSPLSDHPLFGERIKAVLEECEVVGDKQRDCKKAMVAIGTVVSEYVKVHQGTEGYLQGLLDSTCSALQTEHASCKRITDLQSSLLTELLKRFEDPKIDKAIAKLKRSGDKQREKDERARIKAEKAAAKALAKRQKKWRRSKAYKACAATCESGSDGCLAQQCAMPEDF